MSMIVMVRIWGVIRGVLWWLSMEEGRVRRVDMGKGSSQQVWRGRGELQDCFSLFFDIGFV